MGVVSEIVQAFEDKVNKGEGIDYTQERMRSNAPLQTYEYKDHQGIEYNQERMRSSATHVVLPTYIYENQKGLSIFKKE